VPVEDLLGGVVGKFGSKRKAHEVAWSTGVDI